MQFLCTRSQSSHGIEAWVSGQIRPFSQFQERMDVCRETSMEANVPVRARQGHQIGVRQMELAARPFAHEARIGKRHKIIERRRDEGLLDRHFNSLSFSSRVALTDCLQDANRAIEASYVLAKRASWLDRW